MKPEHKFWSDYTGEPDGEDTCPRCAYDQGYSEALEEVKKFLADFGLIKNKREARTIAVWLERQVKQ